MKSDLVSAVSSLNVRVIVTNGIVPSNTVVKEPIGELFILIPVNAHNFVAGIIGCGLSVPG